jgi:hypothetical protein
VPLGQARAAVRSSALGVTVGTIPMQTSTTSALSRYPGPLAYRQRVKRLRRARAAVRWSALGVTVSTIPMQTVRLQRRAGTQGP